MALLSQMKSVSRLELMAAIADQQLHQVLDTAFEEGCTHWDTSDVYGDSEELIGKWCVSCLFYRMDD
jgi:aryl-alcohol dehydrogenase-like predicted oxidoreductase